MWFYSAAYKLLKKPELLDKAEHAFRFLLEHFYDGRYGGVFWSVKADGTPEDTTKHTYNQAFAVYALSVFYQASGKKDALNLAYNLYQLMESKFRDNDGYFEAFSRNFSPVSNEKLSENGVDAERTMNTLLHVLETYTELYRADEFYAVGDAINGALHIFKFKVYDDEKEICRVFFDKSYNSVKPHQALAHAWKCPYHNGRMCIEMIQRLAD